MGKKCSRALGAIASCAALIGVAAAVADRIDQKRHPSAHRPFGPYEKYIKRPLDAVLSAGSLAALSPVMAVTALLVRCKLGTPVVFTQERPGRDGRIFRLYKFRSMTDARDENGALLPDTVRLTSFGRKLRATSLDELPELINIVKGDMSLIGPRPLLVRYLPAYTERERHRHDVRPGLSGLAQIHGRNYVPWDERLAYDVDYVNKITFLGDLRIVIKTLLCVLKRDDVAADTEEIDEGYLDEIRGVSGRNETVCSQSIQ